MSVLLILAASASAVAVQDCRTRYIPASATNQPQPRDTGSDARKRQQPNQRPEKPQVRPCFVLASY